tara:strand:- start:100774 stop:100986 length:213 start_codon:yes stop_codon:yes gene_type:complete
MIDLNDIIASAIIDVASDSQQIKMRNQFVKLKNYGYYVNEYVMVSGKIILVMINDTHNCVRIIGDSRFTA